MLSPLPSRSGSKWLEMVSGTNGTFQPYKAASVRLQLLTEAPAMDVHVPEQTAQSTVGGVLCFSILAPVCRRPTCEKGMTSGQRKGSDTLIPALATRC